MRKRPWFQFHLSTAVVLMFVAGGLINANICWYDKILPHSQPHSSSLFTVTTHGWPVRMLDLYHADDDSVVMSKWNPISLIANILFALAILLSVALFLEWRIRRRAAKQ